MKKIIFILLALLYSTSSFASETITEAVPNGTECINTNSLMLAILSVMHDYSFELATLHSLTTGSRNAAFAEKLILDTGCESKNIVITGLMIGFIEGIITAIEVRCIGALIKFFSGKVLEHFKLKKLENNTELSQKIKFGCAAFILRTLYKLQTHVPSTKFICLS